MDVSRHVLVLTDDLDFLDCDSAGWASLGWISLDDLMFDIVHSCFVLSIHTIITKLR